MPRVFRLDSFYLGNFGKVPVFLRVDVIFLAIWVLSGGGPLVQKAVYLGVILLTVLLHELGHALVATVRGMHGVAITITGMGGYCSYAGMPEPSRKLLISIAGPLTNFLVAWLCWMAMNHVEMDNDLLGYAISAGWWVNLWLGIINSLPIYPLDGGQSLLAIAQMTMRDSVRARRLTLSFSFGTAIVAMAFFTWMSGGNIPYLLFAIFVFALFQAYQDLR